jgi:ATP-dependent Lon protease
MIKKAGVNPVFLLDEVDKMSMDLRHPAAAMPEVLILNRICRQDHYLDVNTTSRR